MEAIFLSLIVTLSILFITGVGTLIMLGYFKWKEYKQRQIGRHGSRRHGAPRSHSRRRTRRIRVHNMDTHQTLNNSGKSVTASKTRKSF